MNERDWLAGRFEEHRSHLWAVAYRMLGSASEADDAVQESWLRLSGSDLDAIQNLGAWLTTVVSRLCLNILRSRRVRGEESLDARVPDPIVSSADGPHPEQQLLLADSLSLALLVVLETLTPAERVAFVLHDMLAMSFDEIALIVGRSPAAVRQLASRARRRVKRTAVVPDADVSSQRKIIEAFLVAARGGDFEAIVALLDPNVILRADAGSERGVTRGARTVAKQALFFSSLVDVMRPALVNGSVGIVSWRTDGQPFSILALTVARSKIVEIDILADPVRLQDLHLPASH